jgi:hypothetical protein
MSGSMKSLSIVLAAVTGLLCLPLAGPIDAEPGDPPGDPAMALKPEQVRQLADQAKRESGLNQATAKQIQAIYAQALEQPEPAAQWRTKDAECESLRFKVPEQLRGLTDELSRPLAEVVAVLGPIVEKRRAYRGWCRDRRRAARSR